MNRVRSMRVFPLFHEPANAVPQCRSPLFFVFVLLLACLMFCGCVKDAVSSDEPTAPVAEAPQASKPSGGLFSSGNKEKKPVDWNLSDDARHMYYYLLLNEALLNEDEQMLFDALTGLMHYEPSLPMFQDGVGMLLSRGRFEQGRDLALQGLRSFPEDETLVLMLSVAYGEMGQNSQAIDLLEEARKKKPESSGLIQELMRAYVREGRIDKSEALFLEMPVTGFDAKLHFLRAHILAGSGRTEEAIKALRTILDKQPDFLEAWLELALIAERRRDLPAAIEYYTKASQISPDNQDIWFRLMVAQVDAKKPQAAMKTIEKAPTDADFLLQASYFFIEAGYTNEAAALLQEAESHGAHPDEVLLQRSVLQYRATDDVDAALSVLEDIAPSSSFYQKGLLRRIQLLLDAKQLERALTTAEFAKSAFADQIEFWTLESYLLTQLKRYAEAEERTRRGLELYPGNEELLYALGGIMEETQRRHEAFEIMEELLRQHPENAKAMNYIGYTLADEGRDMDRALELVTKALQQYPDADYIVDSLAWVQYRMGRFEEAWQSINRCLELGGDDPTIWEHYGDIAKALGKIDEARKGYEESLKREPGKADIEKKLSDLPQ